MISASARSRGERRLRLKNSLQGPLRLERELSSCRRETSARRILGGRKRKAAAATANLPPISEARIDDIAPTAIRFR